MDALEKQLTILTHRVETEKEPPAVPIVATSSNSGVVYQERTDEEVSILRSAVISLSNKLHVVPDWNVYNGNGIQFLYPPFVDVINEERDAHSNILRRYMGFTDGYSIEINIKSVAATTTIESWCASEDIQGALVRLNNIPTCHHEWINGGTENTSSAESYDILVPAEDEFDTTKMITLEFTGPSMTRYCEQKGTCGENAELDSVYQKALRKIKASITLPPPMKTLF